MKVLALIKHAQSDQWSQIGEGFNHFFAIEIFEKVENELARETFECGTTIFSIQVQMLC
jgi:hypothetical protein